MNRKLNNKIETIFLMSDVKNQIISSRLIKEVAELNGDIKNKNSLVLLFFRNVFS